jgi:hypothetical protein
VIQGYYAGTVDGTAGCPHSDYVRSAGAKISKPRASVPKASSAVFTFCSADSFEVSHHVHFRVIRLGRIDHNKVRTKVRLQQRREHRVRHHDHVLSEHDSSVQLLSARPGPAGSTYNSYDHVCLIQSLARFGLKNGRDDLASVRGWHVHSQAIHSRESL